ncbi:hypothetical protein ONE63_004573 [Megalurothrips usitatus]|uniref:ATP-dependent DNA helicase 2 subunit 1 n=1 Tax=Megalurothrips usitatus TaxID=439358 RepID=A0AAV7X3F6_9NEOP|nr:hypothetical protein ONE63_004573 [Megalurothrips usitatus]
MTQTPAPWAGIIDDGDDNLDTREGWMWGGKNAIIFLIDATEPMFEKHIDDSSYFMTCIEACKEMMLQAVFHQDKDLFGIVAYGTKHVNQGAQANHITTVQDLSCLNADIIKELLNILGDVDKFENKHGHSNNFSLADALWHCSSMVSKCTTKLYEKKIFLMTCNDNPHATDPKLQNDTRMRARNVMEMGLELKILPFGMTFTFDNFFKEVYQIMQDENDPSILGHNFKIVREVKDIVACVARAPSKRSVSRVLWSLGNDIKLGVAAYSFVRSAPPFPKKQKVTRLNNAVVTSQVSIFRTDTGEAISAAETSKAIKVGGQTVTFEAEELRRVKRLTSSGLVLLGFKPIRTIQLWYHKKKPVFIYPEERKVKGSRTLFAALHERCLAREMCAICYFTPRTSAKPSLVALIPLAEKLDSKTNTQFVPPGFILKFLPYVDNIRDLKEQEVNCSRPDPKMVSVAEEVIDKMRFKFSPSNIDNPKLQKHWSGLEALALGYAEPKEFVDFTVPEYEAIDARINDLAETFSSMAFPDGYNEAVVKKAVKRTAPAKTPAPKKVKPDLNNMSMENIANQGLVEKLTVDKLKSYLIDEDVKVGKMKKAELVEAVYHHLGIQQP